MRSLRSASNKEGVVGGTHSVASIASQFACDGSRALPLSPERTTDLTSGARRASRFVPLVVLTWLELVSVRG
jgi:branched-subunit amino acid transport protein